MNALLFMINNICLLYSAFIITHDKNNKQIHYTMLKISTVFMLEVLTIVITAGLFLQSLNHGTLTFFSVSLSMIALLVSRFYIPNIGLGYRSIRVRLLLFSGKKKLILALIAVVFAALIFKLVNVFLLIPYCYDSTAYHLPNLVDYIQNQKIYLSEKVLWSNVYPRNIEMLNLWNIIYFRNGMTLKLAQYCLTLFGSFGVYGILREQKVKHKFATVGSFLYLSIPIILAQMSTGYVDTSLGSIFICCIYFFLRFSRNQSIKDLIYLSILLGIMLGIKYSSAGYYAVFIGFLAISQVLLKRNIRGIIKNLMIVCFVSIVIGAVWYIFNLVHFGNPMYPFKIGVFGHTIFDGIDMGASIMDANTPELLRGKNKVLQVLISWIGISRVKIVDSSILDTILGTTAVIYDQGVGGFGFQWMGLMVPSFIILLYKRLRAKNLMKGEVFIAAITAVSFLITPSNWWARYTCFIVILGIYCFIKLIDEFADFRKLLVPMVVLAFLGCLQGSAVEIWNTNYVVNSYAYDRSYPIRSGYTQLYHPDQKSVMKRINNNDKDYDIICFGGAVNTFYFQGDRTQNRVKCYYAEYDKLMKNYNMNTYEKFSQVLKSNHADFIIVTTQYKNDMDRFTKENGTFKLSFESQSDIWLYERQFEQ